MIANVSALVSELKARAETGSPVTIGLAGAGQMGTDIVVQLSLMPGLRLGAISEVNADATGSSWRSPPRTLTVPLNAGGWPSPMTLPRWLRRDTLMW
jgi:hypothetical protein